MNHPIHPESLEFGGLVMGREAVAVSPVALTNEQIHAIIREQAALAAPVAAQQEPVAWRWKNSETGGSGYHPIRGHGNPVFAHLYSWEPLYTHPFAAQPVQPAVPVTDAEARQANSVYVDASLCGQDAMRAALEGFLASRGQA